MEQACSSGFRRQRSILLTTGNLMVEKLPSADNPTLWAARHGYPRFLAIVTIRSPADFVEQQF
jgi:hypothetical protein